MSGVYRHSLFVIVAVTVAGMSGFAQGRDAAAPQGAQAAPDSRTAMLMGQVVDADTGNAISGAVVRLGARTAAAAGARVGAPGTPNGPLQSLALTDQQGRFLFHDLPEGNVQVSATAAGYMNPAGPVIGRGGVGTRPVALADGERVLEYRIRLVKFATISGTLLDEAGEPAVGFPVEAVKRPVPGSAPAALESHGATTDDRGFYRISGIPPGSYFVMAPQVQVTMPAAVGDDFVSGLLGGSGGMIGELMSGGGGANVMGAMAGVRVGNLMWSSSGSATGDSGPIGMVGMGGMHTPGPPPSPTGRLAAYQTQFYPAALSSAQASTLTLRSGEEREGIDLQLRPVPTSRVSGVVTGPSGPVKNISVRLMQASAEPGGANGLDVAEAMTAGDGTFTMLGVPAGDYIVKVEKQATPDFREMMASLPPEMQSSIPAGLAAFMPQGSKETLSAETTVGVGDTDVTGVALVMTPGAHIVGRVEFVGNGPRPPGDVVEQFTVSAMPLNGSLGMGPMQDKVAANGDFKTASYPPGKYFLSVTPSTRSMAQAAGSGLNNWMVKSVMIAGRDVTNDAIDLKATDVTDVVITFTNELSSVDGSIKEPSSGGFDSVSVVFVPADYKRWLMGGGMQRRPPVVTPGPKGNFNIARVTPGDYLIIAVDNGVLEATQSADFYDRIAQRATRISVGDGEKKTISLDVIKEIK